MISPWSSWMNAWRLQSNFSSSVSLPFEISFSNATAVLCSCSDRYERRLLSFRHVKVAKDSSSVISHQGINLAILNFLTTLQKQQLNHEGTPHDFRAQFP